MKKIKLVTIFPKLYRPRYELNKIRWEFNPYDNDLNPKWSIPHGDDIYPKYHTLKLNVDTGYIYSANGDVCRGKLTKKDFERLKNDKKFQNVRIEAEKHAKKQYSMRISNKLDTYSIELSYIPIKKRKIFNIPSLFLHKK